MSRRGYDDDYDDDRGRRGDYDDDYGRRRAPGGRSGGVTGVGVYGIVLGSLSLLLGICMMIGVVVGGSDPAARGAFQIPGFGSAFAIVVIITLLILAWSILTIIGCIGVLNRRQSGRIITFITSGLGGAYGLFCLFAAVMVLAAPDPFGAAGGAKMLGFLIYFVMAALFITFLIWGLVALIKNGHEFS